MADPTSFTEEPQLQGDVPVPSSFVEETDAGVPSSFEPEGDLADLQLDTSHSEPQLPTGMPELLARPPEAPAQAEQPVASDNMALLTSLAFSKDPQFSNPLAIPQALGAKFKKGMLDPIVRWGQDKARDFYMSPTGGKGEALRKLSPGTGVMAESLLKPFIGETEFNTQNTDKLAPEAGKGISDMQGYYGPTGAAAVQSVLTETGNLPFFLIPGFGPGAVSQGATGGFLSAAVDPEADLVTSTVGGAVVGAGLEGLAKVGGKVIQAVKGKLAKPQLHPIAVVPPDAEGELAQKILEMPDAPPEVDLPADRSNLTGAATPKAKAGIRRGAPATPTTVAVGIAEDGSPVFKALHVGPGGAKATPVDKPKKGWDLVLTDAAKMEIEANPNGELANSIFPPPDPELSHTKLIDIQDWEASRVLENRPGKVLVLESDVVDGSARLYNIDDPKIQRATLSNRGLVEVTQADGSKVLGYKSGDIIVPPDPAEGLPRPAQNFIPVDDTVQYKHIEGPTAIDNILIERKQLMEAAEGQAAKAQADQSFSQADIALGGDGSGGRLPPGPPMDPPPPPPPGPHNVDPSEGIKLKYTSALGNRINKFFLNPTSRGWQDVADLAFSSHSVDTFERLRDDVLKVFQKATPEIRQMKPVEQKAALAAIDKYLTGEGTKTLEQLRAEVPEITATVAREVDKYKAQISRNQQRLQELGMLSPEKEDLLDDGSMADYATRMYYRFLMKPGEWAKLFKKDKFRVERLKRAIIQDVYSTGRYAQETERARDILATDHLNYLLGDPETLARAQQDPAGAWRQRISEAGGSLKQRKDLAPWKREALGEVANPFVRIAESIARQEQLIVQGEMFRMAAANPNLSSAGDDVEGAFARGHTDPVPQNPALYGQLAGRKVAPETWEALVTAPLAQRNIKHTMNSFVNAMKFNQTVGNPGSWVTNFFANAQGMMLSNLTNPFTRPLAVGRGMLNFVRDLKAFKLAPGIKGDIMRDRFTRAMELGIVGSDFSTAEFRESASLWAQVLEDEAKRNGGRVNPLTLFPRQLKDQLARKYGAIDSLWKYAAYSSGLEKAGVDLATGGWAKAGKLSHREGGLVSAINFIGERYKPNMSDARIREMIELEIAQRIHYSFPMLDRVGEGVATMSKAAGIVNPYFKVKAELIRNYAQIPKRMLNEKGMTANMVAMTALVGGTYFTLRKIREEMGVKQDEIDAAFASQPDAVQRFKPGAMALWSRAPDGRLRMIDMTQMFEPLTWTQGDPDTALPVRFLQNIALSPVDGSLLEPELMQQLAQSGMVDAAYARPNVPQWQQGGAQMIADTLGRVGPGIFRNTYNTLERGGIGFEPKGGRGPDNVPVSSAATAINMITGPNRITEVGGPADKTRAIQAKVREVDQAEAELNAIGPKNQGQSVGVGTMPLDKAEAFKRARAVLDQKKKELDALRSTIGR